jgi:uncharacterized membrane protein
MAKRKSSPPKPVSVTKRDHKKDTLLHRNQQKFKSLFFTGVFVLLPVIVTAEVFWWLLVKLDSFLKPMLLKVIGDYHFGIGIALMLLVVMAVGFLAQFYIGKRIVRLIDFIFERVPLIRTIHSVVRQLLEPFSSDQGRSFRQVVLVEYPMKERYALGFIANEDAGEIDGQHMVTVFVPTNHLHLGNLLIMPEDQVVRLDLSVEETLKIVVSCGIVVPKTLVVHEGEQIHTPEP